MSEVVVAPAARRDLERLVITHHLPSSTRERVGRSLVRLEAFPRLGVRLGGRWAGSRLLIGPWPWMILIYELDEAEDRVAVTGILDGRSSAAPGPAGRP